MSYNPLRRTFLANSSHQDPSSPTEQTHIYTGDDERFQYATCPLCSSDRARLTKQIIKSWPLFSIFCPFCGYEDSDVSDH